MRISIRHQLSVTPPPGTANAVLQLLLTPGSGPTQKVESWTVDMPGIDAAGRFTDAFGNPAHLVNQSKPEGALLITIEGRVATTDRHGVLGRSGSEPVAALFRRMTPLTKAPATLFGKFRDSKDSRLDILHALMVRVGETLGSPDRAAPRQSQSMGADGSMTQSQDDATVTLPPAEDYAHSFIGACRALDIPARFVTGYLAGAEDGVSPFHSWAEAYDERLGWIGFDARLQLCPTDRHVRLAVGLDAASAQPVRTVPAGDGITTLDIAVHVID